MKKHDPENSIGFVLSDVARLIRRDFYRRVENQSLTPAQSHALACIAKKEGIKQGELAQQLEVQPITASRMVDRLTGSGWVERHPDPDDRRTVRLFTTEAAQPILDFMWEQATKTREEALRTLSDDDREFLLKTLQTIRNNLLSGACGTGPSTPDDTTE